MHLNLGLSNTHKNKIDNPINCLNIVQIIIQELIKGNSNNYNVSKRESEYEHLLQKAEGKIRDHIRVMIIHI